MEDTLIVSSAFDPSGLTRGLDIGAASLEAFQRQVRETAAVFPSLDISKIAIASAEQVRKEAQVLADLNAKVAQASGMVGTLGTQTKILNSHFEAGRQGGRRLESALTGIALAGAGVNGVTGRIVEGLVMFGAAKVELLETAAAIGVVVAGYQLFTQSMREANAARDKLVAALHTRIESNLSGITHVGHEVAATEEDRALLERMKTQVTLWEDIGRIRFTQGKLDLDIAERVRQENEGILLIAQQRVNAEIAVLNFQRAGQAGRLTDLGASAGLGTDTLATMHERAAEMRRLIALTQDEHTSLRERNEAQIAYNALLDATLVKTQRAFAATALRGQGALAGFQHLGTQGIAGELSQIAGGAGVRAAAEALGDAAVHAEALAAGLGNATPAALKLAATARDFRVLQTTLEDVTRAIPRPDEFDKLIRSQLVGARGTGSGSLAVKQAAEIDQVFQNAQAGLQSVNTAFDDLQRHLIQTNEFWRKATKEVTDHRTAAEKAAETLFHFGDAVGEIASVGQQLGFLSQDALDALGSVQQLAGALASLQVNPGNFAGILGLAGAGVGLAGKLFGGGESAAQREQRDLLKQNNQRLADLRASLDHQINSLPRLTGSQETLAQLQRASNPATISGPFAFGIDEVKAFEQTLAASGQSVEDFAARIRAQTGLEILDKQGHIVSESLKIADAALRLNIHDLEAQEAAKRLDAVAQAAKDAADRLVQMNQSYQALFPSVLQLRDQLLGVSGDPIRQFQTALESLAFTAPDLAAQFNGANLNDPAAREALRKQLLAFVNQILSGQLGIDALGLTPEAFQVFQDFLNQSSGILDGFNKSVQDATKALLNIPQGLNLTMLEFQAQRAGMGLPAAKPVNLPLVDFPSGSRGRAGAFGNDGASLPVVQQTITVGDIIIQGAGKNAEEIADAVDRVIKRKNMSKFGNPDGRRA